MLPLHTARSAPRHPSASDPIRQPGYPDAIVSFSARNAICGQDARAPRMADHRCDLEADLWQGGHYGKHLLVFEHGAYG